MDMLLGADDGYDDLLLMDIQMPNMDGYDAARSIRGFKNMKKAATPILAMTANAIPEDFKRTIATGMDVHIANPLDKEKIFHTITDALRRGQKR